jgi:hypothetical protein
LEVARAEHAQLAAGVDAGGGRDGVGGALAGEDDQVVERAGFLEDADERGADVLAVGGVTRELLDFVDDDQLARVGGQGGV